MRWRGEFESTKLSLGSSKVTQLTRQKDAMGGRRLQEVAQKCLLYKQSEKSTSWENPKPEKRVGSVSSCAVCIRIVFCLSLEG
jgi:hypothetical protein